MKLIFISIVFIIQIYAFAQKAKEVELVLLYVNDMHGKIDQFPFLSTLVKDIKQKNKNVLFLSAGDIFSGNPIVDRHPKPGFPMIDLMNMLPLNYSTLGNHEFDFGGKVLTERIKELNHKVLVANIVKQPDYFPKLKPYDVIDIEGVKIAIIGLTQVSANGYPDTHPDRVKEFAFEQGITTALKWLPKLKKYPVKIVLSHMGYEQDSLLATKASYITAIVGGHSHKKIQPMKKINNVAIVQAENYLKYLGVMKVKVNNNKIITIWDTLLPITKNINPDSVILNKVNFYNNNEEFLKVIGYASDSVIGIQALGCMMTDAYRKILKTDFALQNSGGIRISMIPQGNITIKQIYELDPFDNELLVCKMKPENLRQIINFGYEKEGKLDIFSSGFTSKVWLNENKKIFRIELYDLSGNLLDETKTYQVAIGSYLYNAYKFDRLGEAAKSGITTTEAILKFLSQIKGLSYKNCYSSFIVQ